jgi:hypothetical protein
VSYYFCSETASFRGRPLNGCVLRAPTDQHAFFVVHKVLGANRTEQAVIVDTRATVNVWHLDKVPSTADALHKTMALVSTLEDVMADDEDAS